MLTRRQGLVGMLGLAVAGTLAACSSAVEPGPAPSATASASAADPTVADEQALLQRYDATIAAYPSLAQVLGPIREQHAQHVTALGASPATAPSPLTSGASTASDADLRGALTALIDAERAAMRQRIDASVSAGDAAAARTLAFIAASEGSHIPALRELRP
jgi:hypothetical protein